MGLKQNIWNFFPLTTWVWRISHVCFKGFASIFFLTIGLLVGGFQIGFNRHTDPYLYKRYSIIIWKYSNSHMYVHVTKLSTIGSFETLNLEQDITHEHTCLHEKCGIHRLFIIQSPAHVKERSSISHKQWYLKRSDVQIDYSWPVLHKQIQFTNNNTSATKCYYTCVTTQKLHNIYN